MSSQSHQLWSLLSQVLFSCLLLNAVALPIGTHGPNHETTGESQDVSQGQTLQGDNPILGQRPANVSGKAPRSVSADDSAFDPSFAAEVQELAGKTWNLDRCLFVVQLRLGDKILNQRFFYCTESDALKLAPLLMGETLLERLYVWCRTAQLYNSISSDATSFDVRELNLLDGDMFLSRENVDIVLAEFFPSSELRGLAMDAALAQQRRGSQGGHRHGSGRRAKRKVIVDRSRLWFRAVVPYKISNLFSLNEQFLRKAISEWEEKTCVRFVENNVRRNIALSGVNFVLQRGTGCSASGLGKLRYGTRVILTPECAEIGVAAHEIGHVLGFYHEHTRPDRDRYVTIVTENIQPKYLAQFGIKQYSEARTHGIPYDYSSVMHYSTSSNFGITANKTIVTADPQMQFVIGQREYISFYDAKLANTVYCSGRCEGRSLEWSACKHGGYRNPNNCSSCLCPRGLAPPRCESPAPGIKADCDRQTLHASGLPQTLTSPGYHDNGFPGQSSCFWLIKTSSPGKRIRLQFTERFKFSAPNFYECEDHVEIRYKGLMRSGPKFCGSEMPEKIFVSHGDEMLIQIHNQDQAPSGAFQVKYIEEYCGGCSVDASAEESPCLRVVQYNCSQSGGDSVCFMEEPYCCDGYHLEGERCKESPTTISPSPNSTTPQMGVSPSAVASSSAEPPRLSTKNRITLAATRPPVRASTDRFTTTTTTPATKADLTTTTITTTTTAKPPARATRRPITRGILVWWGGWTACSATCGLCGTQSRQRYCYGGYCYGNPYEVRRCGSTVCPVEIYNKTKLCLTLSTKSRERCFWNQCYSYKTYICKEKAVKPRCCVGTPVNGICQR